MKNRFMKNGPVWERAWKERFCWKI